MIVKLKVEEGKHFHVAAEGVPLDVLDTSDIADNILTLAYILLHSLQPKELEVLAEKLTEASEYRNRLIKHGHADANERLENKLNDIQAKVSHRIIT